MPTNLPILLVMYIMYIALAGDVACHRDFPALVKHGMGIGMACIHPVQCKEGKAPPYSSVSLHVAVSVTVLANIGNLR